MKEIAEIALDQAVAKGAEYADVRVARYRRQNISVEDQRVSGLSDTEDIGFGVRALYRGAWGFAGSSKMTREEAMRIAEQAVAIAMASASALKKSVRLTEEAPTVIDFRSEVKVDPFTVPVESKIGLLLKINQELLKPELVKKAFGFMTLRGDERLFMSSEGSHLSSYVVTTAAGYQATAVKEGDAQSRTYMLPPRTIGYENIDAEGMLANASRVAAQAVELLSAKPCPDGVTDLILDPHNLALTIHESVGHATELDRALGYEESLAGRSFATPDRLRNLKYGSDLITFQANNQLPGGLATQGFDDDGVLAQEWNIVEDGLFVGYSAGREVAAEIGMERSPGGCRADHWGSIPIVRIPNLSLTPGREPLSLEELISDTSDGIYIEGMGSFSIDQMRCNFQFGGDACWEIKDGRIVGMLRDVTYQSITTDFWNSCDAICDERYWAPNGVLNCGKGDPMQVAQMTHGAAPARFRNIRVGAAR